MSTVSRTILACGDCGNSGAAIWNFANDPIELIKAPEGFIHAGRGRSGEEYFTCSKCRQAIKSPSPHLLLMNEHGAYRRS